MLISLSTHTASQMLPGLRVNYRLGIYSSWKDGSHVRQLPASRIHCGALSFSFTRWAPPSLRELICFTVDCIWPDVSLCGLLKAMWEGRNTPKYMGFQPRGLVLHRPGLQHTLSLSPLFGSKNAFQTASLEAVVHMPR